MLFLSRPTARFRLLVTLVALSVSVAVGAKDKGRMSDQVAEYAMAGSSEMVDVIVTYKTKPSKEEKKAQKQSVDALGGKSKHAYEKLGMRSLSVPASALNDLAKEKDVKYISLDGVVEAFVESARLTANLPGKNSPNEDYEGNGVVVAVIDSGVVDHTDIDNSLLQYSFLGGNYPEPDDDQMPSDDFGHGTHVAGILAGDGTASLDKINAGFARKAETVSLQVLDANGQGAVSDLIAALDWLLQYGQTS